MQNPHIPIHFDSLTIEQMQHVETRSSAASKRSGHTYKGRNYCSECGNPDCPNVDPDPFFSTCPGAQREGNFFSY